jgi:sulfite reductase (ferredoxin)
MPEGKSKVEVFKEQSQYLRGGIAEALGQQAPHFAEAEVQVLKFHGLYQQDDRDWRKQAKHHFFMVRSKIPGGCLTAEQYLVHDDLATRYGNGTLRITTRQDFQIHGVLKGDLQATLRDVNASLITTLGACGDLVRNVMCCPVPAADRVRTATQTVAQRIFSDHLLPRTKAYHEIWLDGEQIDAGQEAGEIEEPIYGKAYLPRKFKIGIAPPGDNCIDVYTQDIGLVAVVWDDVLQGFNVLVGGGMGMTHNKPNTFPRLADPLAFVTPEQVIPVVEHIVCIQRDYGDRANRKHARMKYLIHEWGLERFRDELERRLGYALRPVVLVPPLQLDLHLGWHQQGDDRWYLGISVENGRIQDLDGMHLKTGLREVITTFRPGVRLSPNHDILLTDVHDDEKVAVEVMLRKYGMQSDADLSNVQKYSMACPALPTCGLALAEAERALPSVINQLETEMARLGLQDETMTVRMTGCPNGCARPYVADLAFVGRSLDKYVVYVGGRTDGTRLNQSFKDLVPTDALVDTVLPLFVFYEQEREPGESFGDFCARVGIEALQTFTYAYQEKAVHTGATSA